MTREVKSFCVVGGDGRRIELVYNAPYSECEHNEMALLKTLPWFESGKPCRNWMLHSTDFYDEVEKTWGKRWGAEGIGRLREVILSKITSNEVWPEYELEPQYYQKAPHRVSLEGLQEEFEGYVKVLKENGVTVNLIEPPVPAIGPYGYVKNFWTASNVGSVVKGGAIVPRTALGPWQRGREVIFTKAIVALGVPIYYTVHGKGIAETGGFVWLDGRRFVVNEGIVANEEGIRQIKPIYEDLGLELVVAHTPGWLDTLGERMEIGTSHIDMVISTVDLGLVLVYPALMNYGMIRYLADHKVRMIEVPTEEYWSLAVNGILLEPGKMVLPKGSPKTVKALEKEGVDCIEVEFSEFQRSSLGGLHCGTGQLVRDQPSPTLEELH